MKYKIENFSQLIQCNFSTHPPPDSLHMHDLLEILFFLGGDVNFFLEGNSWLLKRGTIIFINKNAIHGPRQLSSKTYRRSTIHFSQDFIQKLSYELTDIDLLDLFKKDKAMIYLSEEQIPKMESLLHALTDEYLNPSAIGHDLLLKNHLSQVLIYAQNCAHLTNNEVEKYYLSELINDTLEYIQNNFTNPKLTVKSISETLSYNDIYLNRQFKKEIGNTIHQYIILCRISLAKKLLQNGLDVQSCCYECGFSNYSNFIRMFKESFR